MTDTESNLIEGLVVKSQSGFFDVQTAEDRITSQVRGRLLKQRLVSNPVALGDRVRISLKEEGGGMIEEVFPRESAFRRQKPSPEGRRADKLPDREQVIIANPDQVVFVFACAEPDPNPRTLDRYIIIAESQGIPIVICANKSDLVSRKEARDKFGIYDALGYPVIYTSAAEGKGINKLSKVLTGKMSALTGPSGVGKSSLLNKMQPGLGLAVQDVSEATTKGRHTTVASELYAIKGGGYIADTPGIRSIGLFNIEPTELDGYFVEMQSYIGECQFSDCRHFNEPGCTVRAAVEVGDIWWERYESYMRLREECEDIFYRC